MNAPKDHNSVWTSANEMGTIEYMVRAIAHSFLILLVLACPALCAIGGGLCCGSDAAEESSNFDSACLSMVDCCHRSVAEIDEAKSRSGEPNRVPRPKENCSCDCLCEGAVTAGAQPVVGAAALPASPAHAVVEAPSLAVTTSGWLLKSNPPDVLSGREIRTLQMSFQV